MSHGLTNKDSMFAVGEKPWHGLGKVLENAPLIDDAIKHAGLCWEVDTEPLFTQDGQIVPARATRRRDTKDVLGVVGEQYTVLQNYNAFKFFQPFLDSGEATLETAGSLFGGKKVFVLAKIKGSLTIVEKANDVVDKYILLSNTHDGGQSARVGYTPIRVVCNNTLTWAEHANQTKVRIRHTGQIETNLENVRETMNLVNQGFEATAEQYRVLANIGINQDDLKNSECPRLR